MSQAESLAKRLASEIEGTKKKNSVTQVRKFYNQVKVVEQKAKGSQENFNAIKPHVRLLQAQAAYSVARGLLSEDFKEFFDVATEKIIKEEQEGLNEFAKFFQAVYAYYYYLMEQEENKR